MFSCVSVCLWMYVRRNYNLELTKMEIQRDSIFYNFDSHNECQFRME